jgi:hypothetical protein
MKHALGAQPLHTTLFPSGEAGVLAPNACATTFGMPEPSLAHM